MCETQGSDPMWTWKNLKKPGINEDTTAQYRWGAAEGEKG